MKIDSSYIDMQQFSFCNEFPSPSELSHQREMPIDCPDGFIPEIKTKPCLPNLISHQLNKSTRSQTLSEKKKFKNHQHKLSLSSNESVKSKGKKSILKIEHEHLNPLPLSPSSMTEDELKPNKQGLNNTHSPLLSHDETFGLDQPPVYEKLKKESSTYNGQVNIGFDLSDDDKHHQISYCSKLESSGADLNDLNRNLVNCQASIDLIQMEETNESLISLSLSAGLKANEIDMDKLLKTCNNDVNLLNKILNSNDFLNKLNMCKKFISNTTTTTCTTTCISTNPNSLDLYNEISKLHEAEQKLNEKLNQNRNQNIYENDTIFKTTTVFSNETDKENSVLLNLNNFNNREDSLKKNEKLVNLYEAPPEAPIIDSNKDDVQYDEYSNIDATEKIEHEQALSDEGKYLLKKAQYYNVDNLKLVNIEKLDEPLGATIKNRDGCILISRIVSGSAAQKCGLLHTNDEILEINAIAVRGKTINDVCDMLANLQGMISFLIVPNYDTEPSKIDEKGPSKSLLHIRALYNYSPLEDLYIPCKELGLAFTKGDILHVTSQDDEDWWQAYKNDDKDQSMAGLIPSQSFQERRFSQMQALIGDSFMNRKKREKGFCAKGLHSNRRRKTLYGIEASPMEEIVTYEEVTQFKPLSNYKRPIVLIGPHNIGRHELRKRLMQSNPSLFEVAVPHTTRAQRRDEVDGKDYHFLPRHIFEVDIKQGRFIEHGEYEKNLYGTSREAIKKVIENSKICVLNLYPQALKNLRSSDLMPFVIYIGPSNLTKLKELKTKLNESYRESDLLDIIDRGREIEEVYGHYFDKIIRNSDMDKAYQELYDTINKVQNEENWVPTSWLSK